MSLLHFSSLLFEHLSVILGDVGVKKGEHDDIEERQKTSLKLLFSGYVLLT